MHLSLRTALAAGAVALLFSVTPAFAEMLTFKGGLAGTAEVPPNDSGGTGTVDATFDTDTKMLTWKIDYMGLSADASAAHFHGPAKIGEVADPVLPIEGNLASPIEGSATLDDAQAADLQAGLWYFNIHTAQYPDGELRAQVEQEKM